MLLDLLVPRRCALCGHGGVDVCSECIGSLPRLEPPLCDRCGAPTAWPVERCRECSGRRLAFAHARAAVEYDDAVRTLVRQWKERGLRTLAIVAADVVAAALDAPAVEAVTAVPADHDRTLRRGHHPAASLADELATRWDLPIARLLERARPAARQRGLAVDERRRNLRGAFGAREPSPRRVLLVDDVYTTGATAAETASALRKAGARHVEVVTFARTIRLG